MTARRSKAMNTRHGMGFGLVGLLLSTVAFAAAPIESDAAEEAVVASSDAGHPAMEEIIVKARHPDAVPAGEELAMYNPLELMSETPIDAPLIADRLLVKPEMRLSL